jgi:hypothetical protein
MKPNIFVVHLNSKTVSTDIQRLTHIYLKLKPIPPMEHFLIILLLICGLFVLISPFCTNARRFAQDPSDEKDFN